MKLQVLLSHRARRVFFFIHLWLGLTLGAWFAVMGITGSVLTWRSDLAGMEMARRYPIQQQASAAKMISLSQAIAAMQQAHPDTETQVLSSVTVPNSKMPFYTFARGEGKEAQTFAVDPYTAQVHPPVLMSEFFGATVQQFHQRLFLGAKGFVTNGFLTVFTVPLLLSGLWLWWPTRLKHLRAHLVIKSGVSLKRTLHDLHNVLGFYLYPILLVVSVTGAMLAFQRIGNEGGMGAFLDEGKTAEKQPAPQKKGPEKKKEITVTPGERRLDADDLIAQSRAAHPRWELRTVKLPTRPEQPLELNYARATGFEQDEKIFINPYTGQEIAVAPGQIERKRTPARQWAHDLHLGEFAGVLSKILYTIAGFIPLGLFVTGFSLWVGKKRKKMTSTYNDL